MKKHRKTILILSLMMSVTTLSILARNKRQDSAYKNIQVFPKDISEKRMDREMELFSKALGVDCGFCHVKQGEVWDFASDSKGHKKEARDMMRLTNDLNARYFGEENEAVGTFSVMNCYTCHRGEEFPTIPWDTAHVKSKAAAMPISPWGNYLQDKH